jgi:hypothetical protein
MSDYKNLSKEKLFKEFIPRSKVQLDIVNSLRKDLVDSTEKLAPKIISYQQIIKENGEYYLLSDAAKEIMPLAKYLNQNDVDLKYILKEFKIILETVNEFDDFNKFRSLFPKGINAANFWIDKNKNIYLMPQTFLEIRQSYSSIDFAIPDEAYFKPPEIISGQKWNKNAYLFNLAAVFYYFLSGEKIFADQDRAKVLNKIQSEKILEITFLIPELPESLNTLLIQMLSKNDSERGDFDQIIEKLSGLLDRSESDIELQAFLKRTDMPDDKSVNWIRKKENLKLYFRQNWKFMLFFLVLGGSLFFGVFSHTPAVITEETKPEQVVSYFYEGVSTKNMNLIDEAAAFKLGDMQRIITESHVIEKMQRAFNQNNSDRDYEQVYSLEDISIEQISLGENNSRFKVNYVFKFTDQEGRYSLNAEDELNLEKINGIWEITSIKGSFAQMIDGDFPWRE